MMQQPIAAMIAMAVLLLATTGCQNEVNTPTSKPSQELATLQRSGGFAPMEVTLTLFNDGRFGLIRIGGPSSFSSSGTLSPRQLQQLREQLAGTKKLETDYDNPQARDDHKFKLTHVGRTIRWSQAYNQLPQPLAGLSALMGTLLGSAAPQR